MIDLIEKLEKTHSLTVEEYERLIESRSPETARILAEKAVKARKEIYGNSVYIRGLVEVGNICKNDCIYCGIRRSNKNCSRYRLSEQEIYSFCEEGYNLGFRTFVLQGGEDNFYTDEKLCRIISYIKSCFPDCAVTLSIGEKAYEQYKAYFDAGADRYLLRHETANNKHYEKLHPKELSLDNRKKCL